MDRTESHPKAEWSWRAIAAMLVLFGGILALVGYNGRGVLKSQSDSEALVFSGFTDSMEAIIGLSKDGEIVLWSEGATRELLWDRSEVVLHGPNGPNFLIPTKEEIEKSIPWYSIEGYEVGSMKQGHTDSFGSFAMNDNVTASVIICPFKRGDGSVGLYRNEVRKQGRLIVTTLRTVSRAEYEGKVSYQETMRHLPHGILRVETEKQINLTGATPWQ